MQLCQHPVSKQKPISDKKRAANRANAQHSTGPRTREGKKKASHNAATHLAFCADLLQPGEDEDYFDAYRNSVLERLCPMDSVELCLADRVVSVSWRLRRLQAADACLNIMEEADCRDYVNQQNRQLEKVLELRQHAIRQDDHLRNLQPVQLPAGPLSPGLLIAHALTSHFDEPEKHPRGRQSCPFERLLNAENRLQGMLHRALKELRDLQSQRRDHPHLELCPFLDPDAPIPDEDSPTANPNPAPQGATPRNNSTPPRKTKPPRLSLTNPGLTTQDSPLRKLSSPDPTNGVHNPTQAYK